MLLSINIRKLSWHSMFLDERFAQKCLLIKRSLVRFADQPVPKVLIVGVGLLQTLCEYMVFWAYYTQYLSWSSTASTFLCPPLHHANCGWMKKNDGAEISTWVFPLESLSNKIYNLVHKRKCSYPNDQYLNETIAYTTTLCIRINWNRQLQFCLYSRWNSGSCGFLLRTLSCIGQCLEHHGCTC